MKILHSLKEQNFCTGIQEEDVILGNGAIKALKAIDKTQNPITLARKIYSNRKEPFLTLTLHDVEHAMCEFYRFLT